MVSRGHLSPTEHIVRSQCGLCFHVSESTKFVPVEACPFDHRTWCHANTRHFVHGQLLDVAGTQRGSKFLVLSVSCLRNLLLCSLSQLLRRFNPTRQGLATHGSLPRCSRCRQPIGRTRKISVQANAGLSSRGCVQIVDSSQSSGRALKVRW